jgi:hypothetical protein
MTLEIELESLENETDVLSKERRTKVKSDLLIKRQEADWLSLLWQAGALFFLSFFMTRKRKRPQGHSTPGSLRSPFLLAMHERFPKLERNVRPLEVRAWGLLKNQICCY